MQLFLVILARRSPESCHCFHFHSPFSLLALSAHCLHSQIVVQVKADLRHSSPAPSIPCLLPSSPLPPGWQLPRPPKLPSHPSAAPPLKTELRASSLASLRTQRETRHPPGSSSSQLPAPLPDSQTPSPFAPSSLLQSPRGTHSFQC